jgi:hypothetical protein
MWKTFHTRYDEEVKVPSTPSFIAVPSDGYSELVTFSIGPLLSAEIPCRQYHRIVKTSIKQLFNIRDFVLPPHEATLEKT